MSGICVGTIPGRKRPCIYVEHGSTIHIIGSFRSVEDMETFMASEPKFSQVALNAAARERWGEAEVAG